MKQELISVIIPCYNAEKYIGDCLEALLNQTYDNIEIIIVNDGSTDNSEIIINDYIEKFSETNKKIIKIKQENLGQAASVNNALKYVQGQYLVWQDSDDFYERDALEVMLNYLKSNLQYEFVRGKVAYRKEESIEIIEKIGESKYPNINNIFDFYVFESDSYGFAGIFMVRMKYFDKCVKNREIYNSRAGQNWQLILPIAYKGKCAYLDKVVYNCRIVKNSHSRSTVKIKDRLRRCDALKDILFNVLNNIEGINKTELAKYRIKIEIKYVKRKIKMIFRWVLSKIKRKIFKFIY